MSEIIGHKNKSGGGQHTHYEAADSLLSISYARVLDLVSEGEIEGLADGLKSVYVDETPLQNADDSMNFKNVTVDFRSGTQIQDYIPGFPSVENEISVGVELRAVSPWVRAITNLSLSAVRITLGVPALSKADTTNGDVLGYKVDYKIELATDGGAYVQVISSSFNGKTTSAYQRTARIDLPTATSGWSIRVTRLTANSTDLGIADKTNVISYTEVIDAKLRYPMSAIIGLQLDAKSFQSVPTRAYDLFGRIVQVPSNYDQNTRSYTGLWDGTFKPSWTNNPAWIFRDLVLSDRYGLGKRITAAQVDKWALYKIAQYCDQMVPNGKGGLEPRFTCNVYLQSQKQAYAVLQDLASIFRGISYWGGGTIMASADMPSDPVYVYTAANVIGGKFSRVGSSKKTRYTTALVSWNDQKDFGRAKVEYIEDAEGISRYGIQQVSLTAFGCTSQGQAQRVGRWALATSRFETEVISFDVGLDGAIALPGQIVRVADPSRMGKRAGGRISTAAGRVVTLDKAPVINVGDQLTCILPSGVSQTRAVASVSGNNVTVGSDWDTVPLAQSVWSVDSSALAAPTYKVLSVTEKDGLTYTITATQHEPGKFAFIEDGTAIQPLPQTSLDVSTQQPPASVSISSRTVSLQDVQKLVLVVSCPITPGAVAYQGAYRFANGNWIDLPRQSDPIFEVPDVLAGSYTAKLSAVNSVGIVSAEVQSPTLSIDKNSNPVNAAVLLSATAPAFHIAADNSHAPDVITIGATLIDLLGPVTFSATGATLSNITDRTADITFAGMSSSQALVTGSVTAHGQTISGSIYINKVQDGAAGPAGDKYAPALLYIWSAAAPSAPAGTSTFTWATGVNSAYTGSDGWAVSPPNNPGTPGLKLFQASKPLVAASTVTTTNVSYVGATIAAVSANGQNGVAGLQAFTPTVYQYALTIPAGPAGSATFTWSTQLFGAAPTGWSLTPGAPVAGYTLWAAKVPLLDSAANATTDFNWTSASISAQGTPGGAGAEGLSYVPAYVATTVGTASTAPAATTGKTSVPAANSSGLPGTPQSAVPALTAGQYLMQFDGSYNPATDQVTWSIPYQSSLKVGSLSAIASNLGTITAGSIDIGTGAVSWHVDAAGNTWAGAASPGAAPYRVSNAGSVVMKSVSIQDGSGNVILSSDSSLASQTSINPNLVERLSSFTFFGGANDAWFYRDTTPGTFAVAGSLNGEHVVLRSGSASGNALQIVVSRVLGLMPNVDYTISFTATSDTAGAGLTLDVYSNSGYDSPGLFATVTAANVPQNFSFTERTSNSAIASAFLRILNQGASGQILVSNVKIEQGSKRTAWCDNVITKQNVSTFIQSAAIGLALIDTASIGQLSALASDFGTVNISTGGYLRSGQTAYNTGAGFWLGMVGGVAKWSIGNSAGKNIRWDGSALNVDGELINTGNLVNNAASGVDTFGTMASYDGNGSSIFNIPVSGGSALILCNIGHDPASGTQGFNVERWNGSNWVNYSVNNIEGIASNISLIGIPAGDYRLMAIGTYGYITNVSVIKLKK